MIKHFCDRCGKELTEKSLHTNVRLICQEPDRIVKNERKAGCGIDIIISTLVVGKKTPGGFTGKAGELCRTCFRTLIYHRLTDVI